MHPRAASNEQGGNALLGAEVEAFLNSLFGESNHFLYRKHDCILRYFLSNACLFCEHRVDAVRGDYNISHNVPAFSLDSDDSSILFQDVVYGGAVDEYGACVFCELCEPRVEFCTVNCERIVLAVELLVPMAYQEVGVFGKKPVLVFHDVPFDGCRFPK